MKDIYTMTEKQVEALAAQRAEGLAVTDKLDGTYLRVLVTGAQAALAPKASRKAEYAAQLQAVETVGAAYYGAVLRGVVTSDIELVAGLEAQESRHRKIERNRRATFARSAKSTLLSWVRAGGDLRVLEAPAVTKGEMRAAINAARSAAVSPGERIAKAQAALLAAAAREGPDEARAYLSGAIEALQAALDDIPANPHDGHLRPAPTLRSAARSRVAAGAQLRLAS